MRVCLVAVVLAALVGRAGAEDWGAKRDPFDRVLVDRFEAALEQAPHDSKLLAQLVALYKRHRSFAALIARYEAKPRTWAALVVTARLLELGGERDRARDTLAEAIAQKPDDVAGAIALGKLVDDRTTAREIYEAALVHATPAQQRTILKELVLIDGRDADYAKLVALDPANVALRVERGDALLAAKQPAQAFASYVDAERVSRDGAQKLDIVARRARALEALHDDDAALAEYQRALGLAPRGHHLVRELTERIIDVHRRHDSLLLALTELEAAWPRASRDRWQWSTLATLYDDTRDTEAARDALAHAIEKSPSDASLRRRMIRLLEQVKRFDEALAQHELAVREIPFDSALSLELADRYWPSASDKAFAVLDKLAERAARDPRTLEQIAERYMMWNRPDLARRQYDAIAKLEPSSVAMVKASLLAGQQAAALLAWEALTQRATRPEMHRALGELMLEYGLWEEANRNFSAAIELDGENPEYWRGRMHAQDGMKEWTTALFAAAQVIAKTREPAARHEARRDLIRVLLRTDPDSGVRESELDKWREAFAAEPPDLDAGFLILEYYAAIPCDGMRAQVASDCNPELVSAVTRLSHYTQVSPEMVSNIAKTAAAAQRYDQATELLRELARIDPTRALEAQNRIADIELSKLPMEQTWKPSSIDDPFLRRRYDESDAYPPRLGLGMRIGLGSQLRGAEGGAMSLGFRGAVRLGPGISLVARADWQQRKPEHVVHAIGGSLGLALGVVATEQLAFVLGVAQRIERRYGMLPGWDKIGVAADFSLDVIGRKVPVGAGIRFEQSLSDHGRLSSVLGEIMIELR